MTEVQHAAHGPVELEERIQVGRDAGDGTLRRTDVARRGDVVLRRPGPWTPAVHDLLRHLELVGFSGAPRVVGDGFDSQRREVLTFIDGGFIHPGPWSLDGATALGEMLRDLHTATRAYRPSRGARWQTSTLAELGGRPTAIGHRDTGPWNIVARAGLPVAFIDWDFAGPVDSRVELAQLCWNNAKLYDDIVAEREGLPPLAERAIHLRAIVDGYELAAPGRRGLVNLMIELAIYGAAEFADETGVMPETTHSEAAWGMAWTSRSAVWMLKNRRALERALR